MEAQIAGKDNESAGVQVFDDLDREHQVVIAPDGKILEHVGPDGVTTEEDGELIDAVQVFARYTAHWETDFDIIDHPWDPGVIRQGIEAIRSLSDGQFRELFEQTYYELQDPSTDAPIDDVEVLYQGIYLAEDGSIREVTGVMVGVTPPGGEFRWMNPEASDKDQMADFTVNLPPYEFDFPFGERFREFLIHHLKCQIRDIYHEMGQKPPEDCRVDGIGKMETEE